jgi:hypothetical protein
MNKMENNKLRPVMVEHLNLKLEKEGSCLRYVEKLRDGNIVTYELITEDKYISLKYGCGVNVTDEFETMVRNFFKSYGVASTGFSNTVKTLFSEVEED